jgi:hypothetical protein
MSNQYYSIVSGNAKLFENAVKSNNIAQGACVCCRSLIHPKYVKETTTCCSGRTSVLCPFCGTPSIVAPSILAAPTGQRLSCDWGKLKLFHLEQFGHLHDAKNFGKKIVATSWYDDKMKCTTIVSTLIPNNKNDASHMRNFTWETTYSTRGIRTEPPMDVNFDMPQRDSLKHSLSMEMSPRILRPSPNRSRSMDETPSLRPQRHSRHSTATIVRKPRVNTWFADRMKK